MSEAYVSLESWRRPLMMVLFASVVCFVLGRAGDPPVFLDQGDHATAAADQAAAPSVSGWLGLLLLMAALMLSCLRLLIPTKVATVGTSPSTSALRMPVRTVFLERKSEAA